MSTEPLATPPAPAVVHEPLPADRAYSFLCTCGAHKEGTIDNPSIYQHHLDAFAATAEETPAE